MDASGDGDDEIAFILAVYQSTFGNPATVKDYLSSLSMVNLFQVRCAPPSMVPERMRLLARKQLLPTILAVISSRTPSAERGAHTFPSGRAENADMTFLL